MMMNNQLPTSLLKIVFQNTNGWTFRSNEHKYALNRYNPDIIMIADTSLTSEQPLKFFPYIVYKHNTQGKHSGVAILIKPNIQHTLVKHKFEHDTIAIQVETLSGPIILAVNYSPPSRGYPPMEDLKWLSKHFIPCYLLADLNAHHDSFPYHGTQNTEGEYLYREYISKGRLHRIGPSTPTFFAHNSEKGTTPDIILGNRHTYHNHFHEVLQASTSDHLPIKLIISTKPIMKVVKGENRKRANWVEYTEHIKNQITLPNLRQASQFEICQEVCNSIDYIMEARQQYIPKNTMVARPFVPSSPKYRRLMKILDHIFKLKTKTRNTAVLNKLTKQRAIIVTELRKEGIRLAKQHWRDIILKTAKLKSKSSKKYWFNINNLRGRPGKGIQITSNGEKSGHLLTDPKEIEANMRGHWKTHFQPLPAKHMHPDSIQEIEDMYDNNAQLFQPFTNADFQRLDPSCPYTRPVKPIDVYIIIISFRDKAPGEDGIRREHLIHLPKKMFVYLAHIFSAALSCGLYPDQFKSAILIFLSKPHKSRCNPANYRPISLLSIIGKIYDKILTERLSLYLDNNNLRHPHQYGFTRNRGTGSSLAMTYEFIARQIPNSTVSLVSRDIKGAFDHLHHDRIRFHLHRIGTPTILLKTLSCFLTNRSAKIRVGTYTGQMFLLLSGSPQGAAPSSELFNLVIQLAPVAISIKQYFSSYADDCHQIISTEGKTEESAIKHRDEIIEAIKIQNEFEFREGLMTEPTKSWILPISKNKPLPVSVDGIEYKIVTKDVFLLGLKLSTNSFCNAQIKHNVNKATATLSSLYRFKDFKSKDKLHLVKLFVLPHLTYPAIPLHTACKTQMSKLQVVQNDSLRFAYNVKYTQRITNEKLHNAKHKMLPINQVLYWRAKSTWNAIRDKNAADYNMSNQITQTPINKEHSRFPSSYKRVHEYSDEPDPLFTIHKKSKKRQNQSTET